MVLCEVGACWSHVGGRRARSRCSPICDWSALRAELVAAVADDAACPTIANKHEVELTSVTTTLTFSFRAPFNIELGTKLFLVEAN